MTQDSSMPEGLQELMDAVRGRKPGGRAAAQASEEKLFPLSAAFIAKARKNEAEEKKSLDEILKTAKPGQVIKGQGIFLGRYTPEDRERNSLRRTFNVLAAPEDLPDETGKRAALTYIDIEKALSALINWHGHDGSGYTGDRAFFQALKDGSYKGEWVIPTLDLLNGHNPDRPGIQWDNLHEHQDTGAFRDTMASAVYWSCSSVMNRMYHVDFSNEAMRSDARNGDKKAHCRPVRLIPVEQGGLQP